MLAGSRRWNFHQRLTIAVKLQWQWPGSTEAFQEQCKTKLVLGVTGQLQTSPRQMECSFPLAYLMGVIYCCPRSTEEFKKKWDILHKLCSLLISQSPGKEFLLRKDFYERLIKARSADLHTETRQVAILQQTFFQLWFATLRSQNFSLASEGQNQTQNART